MSSACAAAGGSTCGIESIELPNADSISSQNGRLFFQAVDLTGKGRSVPNGLAAIVTFKAGTNMSKVSIDYNSENTYVFQNKNPGCVPSLTMMCERLPITRFNSKPIFGTHRLSAPPAVVVLSGSNGIDIGAKQEYDVYVFASTPTISQATIGFTHQKVKDFSIEPISPLRVFQGAESFGIADMTMLVDRVPTGKKVAKLTAPADACVTGCIDPDTQCFKTGGHCKSSVEASLPPQHRHQMFDVMYVYGATLEMPSLCDSCSYVEGGGDASACKSTGDACEANGKACFEAAPECMCDGVGRSGADFRFAPLLKTCKADVSGTCHAIHGMFPCWSGTAVCAATGKSCLAVST
jgi:hypothetical protein